MEKFIVVANFACNEACEDELYSSQWLVGTFFSIDACVQAAKDDLHTVAKDHFECVLDTAEFDTDEDYDKAIAENVETYCSNFYEAQMESINKELLLRNSAEIMYNDFIDSNYTEQRQIVKYYIYKV